MGQTTRTEYGSIEISGETLATIAGAAAVRCYGIVGMVPRGWRQGVSEILGWDALSQGVDVNLEGDEVKIDLYVIMCYGVRIAEVACQHHGDGTVRDRKNDGPASCGNQYQRDRSQVLSVIVERVIGPGGCDWRTVEGAF